MNQEQGTDESGPSNAKRIKTNGEENNPIELDVAAVNEEQQSSDIFKLTVDCFEEIFDFLSLKDLTAIGQTCKRMQRIAGHCFQQNYGAAQAVIDDGTFELDDVVIDCFHNFFQNVKIQDNPYVSEYDEDDLVNCERRVDFITPLEHSTSIIKIEIGDLHLVHRSRIGEMKVILDKAENITIDYYCYDDDLIAACSHVKRLTLINNYNYDYNGTHSWMHRIYPRLEHIELISFPLNELPALKIFFNQNTTIKNVSISAKLFMANQKLFKNLNINFDTLAIDAGNIDHNLHSLCRLLNEFNESGFYKQLHFYCRHIPDSFKQEEIDQLASLKGLVKLRVTFCSGINVAAFSNLKELCFEKSNNIADLKSLPHSLTKLKRIHFDTAKCDDISLFICHAKQVNKIKVQLLLNGSQFDKRDNVLDLLALNKEREKLVGAQEITIYVNENVYLATKRAMKQTKFSLIEIKRFTSFEWKNEFNMNDFYMF